MLKRDPAAWRDMQRSRKAVGKSANPSQSINQPPNKADVSSKSQPINPNYTRKRKRYHAEADEIDALFSKASHAHRTRNPTETAESNSKNGEEKFHNSRAINDPQLDEVMGAIKKASKKEGTCRTRKL